MEELKKYSTEELVSELAQREGVREIPAVPYEKYVIRVGDDKRYCSDGPARILEVRD